MKLPEKVGNILIMLFHRQYRFIWLHFFFCKYFHELKMSFAFLCSQITAVLKISEISNILGIAERSQHRT